MAITYKGFQVWYCSADPPYENLKYCRNFELTISSISGTVPHTETNVLYNVVMDRLNALFPERANIGGLILANGAYPAAISAVQGLLPFSVHLDTMNDTGVSVRVKLLAGNGSYAISIATIANGRNYFGASSQPQYYTLYDSEGSIIPGQLYLTAVGAVGACMFWYIRDWQGGDIPTVTGYTAGLINLSSSIYGDAFTWQPMTFNISAAQAEWLNAITPIVPPSEDPYEPGGTSGPGGGDGTFDFSSTPVDFVGAPTIGAYDTGMVNLYVPSAADLRSLSAYLWAGAFDLDNFKKLVADPMDAIIGLSILPLTAAQIGTTASTLAVGNISTGISMPRASSQYVTVDCGSIQILPKWGAYLDFSPYSKLQLYLPYIGIVDISPDDCMNGTIAVRYTLDILSGTCYAQVKCNDHVLYNYGATCSTTCPVTSGQYQNVAFAALGAIGGIAGAAISGMAGNVGGVTGGLESAANSVLSSFKPDVSRSGGAGGSAGLMGHQIPYLILTVPRMCTPGYQNEFIGYPAYSTQTLGDLSGYTEIDSIHPAGIPCSEDELAEIVELLNGGVFL